MSCNARGRVSRRVGWIRADTEPSERSASKILYDYYGLSLSKFTYPGEDPASVVIYITGTLASCGIWPIVPSLSISRFHMKLLDRRSPHLTIYLLPIYSYIHMNVDNVFNSHDCIRLSR